jgi:hypothetical protein
MTIGVTTGNVGSPCFSLYSPLAAPDFAAAEREGVEIRRYILKPTSRQLEKN